MSAEALARVYDAGRADGAAEVRAVVGEYVALMERIHEVYRVIVMDTDEERAIHARHVEVADKALALARAALGRPQHLARGANAEDCPACGADTPYPFTCPGSDVEA